MPFIRSESCSFIWQPNVVTWKRFIGPTRVDTIARRRAPSMPLFRTHTQADELARRRSPSLGRRELRAAVRGVVDEVGLPCRRLKSAWMVEFDADIERYRLTR